MSNSFTNDKLVINTDTDLSDLNKLQSILEIYYSGTLFVHGSNNNQQQINIETMLQQYFGSDRDCWKKGILLLANSSGNASMQHVQWFALTLLEESVHHVAYWQNEMKDDERQQVENVLMVNVLPNYRLYPASIWRKACKVVVEIVKMEWPQRWPNFLNQVFNIGNNSDTVVVALTILQMLSEEISSMSGENTRDKDDIPEERKEVLYQSMLSVVDDLLKFLLGILTSLHDGYFATLFSKIQNQQVIDETSFKGFCEIATFALDCLNHVLSWVSPIERYLLSHSNLFPYIVNYVKVYFNLLYCSSGNEEIKERIDDPMYSITTKALGCFSEIIAKSIKTTQIDDNYARSLGNLMNSMYSAMIDLLTTYNGIFSFENENTKLKLIELFSEGDRSDLIVKLHLIVQGFSEYHLGRLFLTMHNDELSHGLNKLYLSFDINLFLERFYRFTTLQFTTDDYQTAVATWLTIIDTVTNSFEEVSEASFCPTYHNCIKLLIRDVLSRIQFKEIKKYFSNSLAVNIEKINISYLEDLDDIKKDSQNCTDFYNHLDVCVELIGTSIETFRDELETVMENFEKNINDFNSVFNSLLPSCIQSQTLPDKKTWDFVTMIFKDLRTLIFILTRLSNTFVYEFDNKFSITANLFTKVLAIQNTGIRTLFENNSQYAMIINKLDPSPNSIGLYRLTEETFSFLQQYIRWIFLFGTNISAKIVENIEQSGSPSDELLQMQSNYLSLVTSVTDNIVQCLLISSNSAGFTLPFDLPASASSLLLLLSSSLTNLSLKQPNATNLNAMAYKHFLSSTIEEIPSFQTMILPNLNQMISSLASKYPPILENAEFILSKIFVSVSSSILSQVKIAPSVLPNIDTKQAQTIAYGKYEKYIASQLVTPFNSAIDLLQNQRGADLLQYISLLFKVLQSILRNAKHQLKPSKQICFENLKTMVRPDLIVNIMNFCLKGSDKISLGLMDVVLDLLLTIFEDWKNEIGTEYIEHVIGHFVELITGSISIFIKDQHGRNVLIQLLKLLKAVVSDGSGKLSGTIPKVIHVCKNTIYPELKNIGEGKTTGNTSAIEVLPYYYDLLYCILNFNMKYFFISNIVNGVIQEQQCTSVETLDQFCFIMECFLNSFYSTDISIFKRNLSVLEDLNDRNKLYERSAFKQVLPAFGNNSMMNCFSTIFINILIAKSHNLYKSELITTLHNMVNAGNWEGFSVFIQQFLSSDNKLVQKLSNDQKQQLLVRLLAKPNHMDDSEWRRRDNFAKRISQFTNDISYSVKQNTRSGLSFLVKI